MDDRFEKIIKKYTISLLSHGFKSHNIDELISCHEWWFAVHGDDGDNERYFSHFERKLIDTIDAEINDYNEYMSTHNGCKKAKSTYFKYN
jgi:hypothetical protein